MSLLFNSTADRSLVARRRLSEAGRQRGSIVVMAAIFLSILLILASSIDIGYFFYMKRDLQKVADLAALAGAQQLVATPLSDSTRCTQALQAATSNAQANGFSITPPNPMANAITPTCGLWDPANNPAPNYYLSPATAANLNAVKVVVSQAVPAFFGLGGRTLSTQAIASGNYPIAAFSLGTGLLSLCSSASPLLAPLVTGLLGSNVCLSAVSSTGLVGAQISLLQLLTNLNVNVGSVSQVLDAKVSLAQLINASISGLSSTQQASITSDLGNLITASGTTQFTISSILNLAAANGVAALDTQINVLDLLNVGTLQVANKSNFIDLGASIAGVGGLSLKLIDPPQIAVGGIGTVATSAQLRLKLNANVAGLLPLPLYIDLAKGNATLTGLQCNAPQSATFSVQTGLGDVCLANGQIDTSAPLTSCPDISNPANQVNVISVFGVPTVSLGINAALTSSVTPVTLYPPPPPGVPPNGPSSKTVGSSLSSILGGALKSGNSPNFVFGGLLSLLNPVLSALDTLLNPTLSLVGAALDSVLSLLGIDVGQSTVNLSSISCSNVKLVY